MDGRFRFPRVAMRDFGVAVSFPEGLARTQGFIVSLTGMQDTRSMELASDAFDIHQHHPLIGIARLDLGPGEPLATRRARAGWRDSGGTSASLGLGVLFHAVIFARDKPVVKFLSRLDSGLSGEDNCTT